MMINPFEWLPEFIASLLSGILMSTRWSRWTQTSKWVLASGSQSTMLTCLLLVSYSKNIVYQNSTSKINLIYLFDCLRQRRFDSDGDRALKADFIWVHLWQPAHGTKQARIQRRWQRKHSGHLESHVKTKECPIQSNN